MEPVQITINQSESATSIVAIAVACIAALASILGVLIQILSAKRSRIAQARLAWMEDTREIASQFNSNAVTAAVSYGNCRYHLIQKDKKGMEEQYQIYVEAMARTNVFLDNLRMRLNPEKHQSVLDVLTLIGERLEELVNIDESKRLSGEAKMKKLGIKKEQIVSDTQTLSDTLRDILIIEWERVKKGK